MRDDAADQTFLPRVVASMAGLVAIWIGCGLVNAPLLSGGPMNLSFSAPLGIPLVALGIVGVALAPTRVRWVAQLLSAVLAVAAAGPSFWQHIPVGDGAFQSLRAGVPDPDTWPASPFLHAFAFAPAGVALAVIGSDLLKATTTSPWSIPLWSVLAAVGSGLGLELFADAMLSGTTYVILGVITAALIAVPAGCGRYPAGRAIAGQAAVLLILCALLWMEWRRVA